jgi:biopolymer transport protein ExbB
LELAIKEALFRKETSRALQLARSGDTSLHHLLLAGLAHWDAGTEVVRELLSQELRKEMYRWNRHVPLLAVIARISPLLGLLGTVLGMVEMFQALPSAGGDMATVASGIWEALFTTVAGLSVAVPVLILHACLCSRIDDTEETLQRAADFLLREHLLLGQTHERA